MRRRKRRRRFKQEETTNIGWSFLQPSSCVVVVGLVVGGRGVVDEEKENTQAEFDKD